MPRPSSPLISKDTTVNAALKIIDEDGLEALSLPRLAREMNVRAPSLYHHFAHKNEILAAVSREIVRRTVFPRRSPTGDWAEWFTQLATNFRTAVLRHRNAAPILLQFMPREMMVEMYERAASYLAECGVPAELHVQILDGLEKLSVGATIAEAVRPASRSRVGFEHIDEHLHPTLARAVAANHLNPKQIFEHTVRCYLLGMEHFGNFEAAASVG
ncbi:MAG: tetracycline repressor protein [Aeromicrobium sp.]|nr:tetracycline repressor protein [Aeromicrobium sp.]